MRTWIVWGFFALSLVGCDSVFSLDHVDDYKPVCRFDVVATGRNHTCALDGAGHVWCWGANDAGQVDDSQDLHALAPRQIPLTGEAVQISAGRSFTCARMVAGTVFCWGANESGQLGTGPAVAPRGGVTQVDLGDTALDLGAGEDYACAVRASDQVVTCWGSNESNTLGRVDGALRAALPGPVQNTAGTKRIGIGHRHNCAVGGDDIVRCWGRGDRGQNGAATTTSMLNVVQGLGPALAVAAGGSSSCAVELTGAVRCWGNDDDGQLGDNMLVQTMSASLPVVAGAAEVEVGSVGACARTQDGSVSCWGLADPGNGAPELALTSTASTVGPVDMLSHHFNHTCVVADHVVQCWGADDEGQLGRGTIATTPTPTGILGIADATLLTVGGTKACALGGTTLSCWGTNDHGEIGDSTLRTTFSPKQVQTQLPSVLGIASAEQRTCAWSSTQIRCWGNAQFGSIGDGEVTRDVPAPALVTGILMGTVVKVVMGQFHTCAVTGTSLQCWGRNVHGELGIGAGTGPAMPTMAALLAGVTDAAAGAGHTCAVASGAVQCWGDNARGQLGYGGGSLNAPGPVLALPAQATQVVAGAAHTCALLVGGDVYCWGANDNGQLGTGTRTMAPMPMKVALQGMPLKITASSAGTCAQMSDGKVVCWGASARGQLGNGDTTDALSPIEIPTLAGAGALGRSATGGCAITAGKTVECWGDNLLLGNGDRSLSVPMDVSCR